MRSQPKARTNYQKSKVTTLVKMVNNVSKLSLSSGLLASENLSTWMLLLKSRTAAQVCNESEFFIRSVMPALVMFSLMAHNPQAYVTVLTQRH